MPVAPDTLDAVVLTHAHIDHTGYLPVLAREGFRGPVYCTAATAELCDIMLRDSARLQEEEADFANRHGYSKHHPAQPLYTLDDAQRALHLLKPVAFDECTGRRRAFRLLPAGHILGAASVVMHWDHKVLAFGRPRPLSRPDHAAAAGARACGLPSSRRTATGCIRNRTPRTNSPRCSTKPSRAAAWS